MHYDYDYVDLCFVIVIIDIIVIPTGDEFSFVADLGERSGGKMGF